MQEERLVAKKMSNDVNQSLNFSNGFHSVWANYGNKAVNIFQSEGSTLKENAEKVLAIINSY